MTETAKKAAGFLIKYKPLSLMKIKETDIPYILDHLVEYFNSLTKEEYENIETYLVWFSFLTYYMDKQGIFSFYCSKKKKSPHLRKTPLKDLEVTLFFYQLDDYIFANSLYQITKGLEIQVLSKLTDVKSTKMKKIPTHNLGQLIFFESSVYARNLWALVSDTYIKKDNELYDLHYELASISIISYIRDNDEFKRIRELFIRLFYSHSQNVPTFNKEEFIELSENNSFYIKSEQILNNNLITINKDE